MTREPHRAFDRYGMFNRMSMLATLCVASSYVRVIKNGKAETHIPLSLILVAPPDSGKTTIIQRFSHLRGMEWVDDMTMRYALEIATKARRGEVTHLLFPEMQRLALRKDHTAEQTFSALSAMMWDGQRKVALGDTQHDFDGARIGVIGAVTPLAVANHRKLFEQHGLYSRGLWIEFSLPSDEREEVVERIFSGNTQIPPIHIPQPATPVEIVVSPEIGKKIHAAMPKGWGGSMRMAVTLRSLVASVAFLAGDQHVREDHILFLQSELYRLLEDAWRER